MGLKNPRPSVRAGVTQQRSLPAQRPYVMGVNFYITFISKKSQTFIQRIGALMLFQR